MRPQMRQETETAAGRGRWSRSVRSPRTVLVVMCVGYFLVLLDVTIVNVALPHIAAGLGANVAGLQWVVDGYAIALASLMLGGGTLGDVHGHRRIVLTGLAVFGVASLGCGLAPATAMLVGFRVLQGAGAALMLPGTLAVITHAYPDAKEQARAIGVWAGIGSSALAAGPVIGGVLTQTIGWRAVFFINVPIVAVAYVVASRVVRESTDPAGKRFDPAGVVLGGALLATATFAFIEAGRSGVGPTVIAAIVAAVILGVAFVVVERGRDQPMLPLPLFRRPAFTASNAIAGAMNLGTLGLLFVLTLYLQDVQQHSALTAGLALFPLFLPLSLLAPIGGRITARTGPRRPVIAGLLSAAIGVLLLAPLHADSGYLSLLPALLLWGVGLGFLTPAVVAAAVGSVAADRAGLASAVNNTARQACGAIGIAAFGALAGQPHSAGFLAGFHTAALIAAGLFTAGAVTAVRLVPVAGPGG